MRPTTLPNQVSTPQGNNNNSHGPALTIQGIPIERARERRVKERLAEKLLDSVDLDEIVEWLREEFGVRVKRDREAVKRVIVKKKEILPQDIVIYMMDMGIEVDEDAWEP